MAMTMEESWKPEESKWEGKICKEVKGASADQVWPLLADFFNFLKWFPGFQTCQPLEGISGQPGCIRYCDRAQVPSAVMEGMDPTLWVKERLVAIDHVERCLSYEVIENNMGMRTYMVTIKVLQLSNEGCQIQWSFVADPVQGLTFQQQISYSEICLKTIAQRMELAFFPDRGPKYHGLLAPSVIRYT